VASQHGLIDEVLEQLDAVEHDNRDPHQVGGVQRVVGLDVDLGERLADTLQDDPRLVAQMASATAIEDESLHYASARSPEA
jgi:hypothetical protein